MVSSSKSKKFYLQKVTKYFTKDIFPISYTENLSISRKSLGSLALICLYLYGNNFFCSVQNALTPICDLMLKKFMQQKLNEKILSYSFPIYIFYATVVSFHHFFSSSRLSLFKSFPTTFSSEEFSHSIEIIFFCFHSRGENFEIVHFRETDFFLLLTKICCSF